MDIISQVAKGMQEILTYAAEIISRHTSFIKRLRKLTGSGFVQTLVFGWLSNPQATLEELSQTAATLGMTITPQGRRVIFPPLVKGGRGDLKELALNKTKGLPVFSVNNPYWFRRRPSPPKSKTKRINLHASRITFHVLRIM
jgi:hypothetical protein